MPGYQLRETATRQVLARDLVDYAAAEAALESGVLPGDSAGPPATGFKVACVAPDGSEFAASADGRVDGAVRARRSTAE
jgi:hypothetical protein